jgi:hypothetical protein
MTQAPHASLARRRSAAPWTTFFRASHTSLTTPQIGWALDGFPVFGLYSNLGLVPSVGGSAPGDTDACYGHNHTPFGACLDLCNILPITSCLDPYPEAGLVLGSGSEPDQILNWVPGS